ncbi:helix-turn-helix transcriptional regulator [Rhodococcus sp. ACS1]|uniref:helix-turn-helix transcriptional regulator n=1 Tax=Rhodococcus koreensis TaxID=99653 RepID=UPI000BB1652C|nr:LuxR C-terminal-related transcriptional regulator [Rhodococcus koreensis]PBC47869.1 helix-turn-helix transcriptional regulator [Rhodococcus sp. ACS1]QSE80483.1 LuxR family transcriptional regulator [Rhodococcus koreensis]
MSSPRRPLALPSSEYERIFAILESCSRSATLDSFKFQLMESLHRYYRCPNTTFWTGHTFSSAFSDPNPVTTGRTTGAALDEYQERWHTKDVFATPQSQALLRRHPAINARQLRNLDSGPSEYLTGFLYRNHLRSASLMHLDLSHGAHALVGLFDSEEQKPDSQGIYALGLLARQLSLLARALPTTRLRSWREGLTARQIEVVELIADGSTNEEVAAILTLSLDTVKKYASRIFALLSVRNRAELVKLVLEEELSLNQQESSREFAPLPIPESRSDAIEGRLL